MPDVERYQLWSTMKIVSSQLQIISHLKGFARYSKFPMLQVENKLKYLKISNVTFKNLMKYLKISNVTLKKIK